MQPKEKLKMNHIKIKLPVKNGDTQFVTEVLKNDFRYSIYPPRKPLGLTLAEIQAKFPQFEFFHQAEIKTEDKPLAMAGLISYRYKGRYGFIMIGAKDHDDALNEANRSLSAGKATIDNLEIWNGEKYISIKGSKMTDNKKSEWQKYVEDCESKGKPVLLKPSAFGETND